MFQLEDSYSDFSRKVGPCLERLYPDQVSGLANDLHRLVACARAPSRRDVGTQPRELSQTDALLIAYADTVRNEEEAPLRVLGDFLQRELPECFSILHLLPFFPWSSDDGFSVVDYLEVAPGLGTWGDVLDLGQHRELMFDLVLNHASSQSAWFQQFLRSERPGRDYFVCADPETDLRAAVRPRSSPLLTPVETASGVRFVWTTFGPDQVDLDFRNPAVLLEMVKVLVHYVRSGARLIRLDAVGFVWKQEGTSCLHLEETHTLVRLLRLLVDQIDPAIQLVSETNVPHLENLSYFGASDEAHLIYNFSLPPLLLHAVASGQTSYLVRFLAEQRRLPSSCCWLHFSSSHDGVGLRPLKGLLPLAELTDLLGAMKNLGGLVSERTSEDGSKEPYELNISWFSACGGSLAGADEWQLERFVCSQAIVMSLAGLPAFYLNAVLAAENDLQAVETSGHYRAINRTKWLDEELRARLEPATTRSLAAEAFNALRRLLELRKKQPAFHPQALQRTLTLPDGLLGLERWCQRTHHRLVCVFNLTATAQVVDLASQGVEASARDLVDLKIVQSTVELSPYAFVWLELAEPRAKV